MGAKKHNCIVCEVVIHTEVIRIGRPNNFMGRGKGCREYTHSTEGYFVGQRWVCNKCYHTVIDVKELFKRLLKKHYYNNRRKGIEVIIENGKEKAPKNPK